jgi:hypothetical protein
MRDAEIDRLVGVEAPKAFVERHSRVFPSELAPPESVQEGLQKRLGDESRVSLLSHAMTNSVGALELAMTVERALAAAGASATPATQEEHLQAELRMVANGMDSTISSEAQTTLQQSEQLNEQEIELPNPDPPRDR